MAGRVPLLAMIALIVAPGLTLGYFGFRALAEREHSLRTNYTATTVLVRDRLAFELARLESSASPPSTQPQLAALEAQNDWLEMPFILRADGSVLTARLHAGMLPQPGDVLATLPAVAAAVFDAERQEFARADLETAVSLYQLALSRVPPRDVAARAFVLTRIGRTLFKLRRFAEGIAQYEAAAALAGDAVDGNGLPYAAIAMLQIIDGSAALRRPDAQASAEERFARYVIGHPWDLDNGYHQHLARVAGLFPPSDTASHAAAAALVKEAAAVDGIRKEIHARVRPELMAQDAVPGEVRHAVIPGGRPALVAWRRLGQDTSVPAVFGFHVRLDYFGGPLLAQVLETVDLGGELHVALTAPENAPTVRADGSSSPALVEVELLPSIPQLKVALFDQQGRTISQLVARERWTYGALVAGMLAVMAVGITLTVRASARATELARARSDFVSSVSHELKTPLALIRMFGETLESGIVSDAEKRQEFYGIIRRESERLTQLIDNVLDLGRIDQGTKHYDIRPHDLIETVQAALEAYRPLFDRMDFTVETAFPPPPLSVPIDRDAIVQSLVNLFQNAIKYSGAARYVSVSVRRADGTASISVADHGVGIAADQIVRIFERYYRAPDAGAAVPAGSGLGLAIVKHTIDAHGGGVSVHSTPGEGTVFTLVLPLAAGQAVAMSVPANPGPVRA
jgi:signal transduction histidine kinase